MSQADFTAPLWRRTLRRRQAWVTGFLVLAIFVAANRLVRRQLGVRFDVSEDRLADWSPLTDKLLEDLGAPLRIEAFFTRDLEHGVTQIAAGRLVDQLDELKARSKGTVEVVYTDPGRSSAARLRATGEYGIRPLEVSDPNGTVQVRQEVFLGLVLSARGREEVLAQVTPQSLEFALLSAVHRLGDPRKTVVGWLAPPERREGFAQALDLLGTLADVRHVGSLESGLPLDQDLEVLFVVAPRELHPRAVYEIERFLRQGGSVCLCSERVDPNRTNLSFDEYATGLEEMLRAFGLAQLGGVVFDATLAAPVNGTRYPFVQALRGDAFAQDSPLVARQPVLLTQWASPFRVDAELPEGLELTELIHSSETAYLVPAPERLELDPEAIELLYAELLVKAESARRLLAFEQRGLFPTAFGGGPPPARDTLAFGPDQVDVEMPDDREFNPAPGRLLAIGDSDWLDGSGTGGSLPSAHLGFLANLVDWLGAEEELVALRTKIPRARPLRDLFAEEYEREGLLPGQPAASERSVASQRAQERAQARQQRMMALASGGSLALVIGLGLVRWGRRRVGARFRSGAVEGDAT